MFEWTLKISSGPRMERWFFKPGSKGRLSKVEKGETSVEMMSKVAIACDL